MKRLAIIKHITGWIKNYCDSYNINNLVVGVSGGIDSALTSTLAAKTKIPLLCVEMPIYQEKEQVLNAKNHIDFLKKKYSNVKSVEIKLTPVFKQLINSFPAIKNKEKSELSLANTRARLRMTTLYYLASHNKGIVVGTGNKIEDFGIGFFTKYGDGAVDISPIADLNKTEVYGLAKKIGILKGILNTPPTDGLWNDNRTDEEQIGASYPELEWAMNYNNKGSLTKRKKEVLAIYKKLNKINQHKIKPIPVCNIPQNLK